MGWPRPDLRAALKLPSGTRTDLPANSREVEGGQVKDGCGTSRPSVRRRIRNYIEQHPGAENIDLARRWLEKLEANPRSREHQKALRELGMAGQVSGGLIGGRPMAGDGG